MRFLYFRIRESFIVQFLTSLSALLKGRDKLRFPAEFQRSSRLREGADVVRYHGSFISVFTIFFALLEWPPRVG